MLTCFLRVAVRDSAPSFCRMTQAFAKDLTQKCNLPLLLLSSKQKRWFVSKLHPWTIRQALTLPSSHSLSHHLHLFPQCIPNPLVVGVEQVGDQVCSIWTGRVIIQRTAAPCPATLQQIHYPGTNLKRSNISSILPLLFPLMQYIWNLKSRSLLKYSKPFFRF